MCITKEDKNLECHGPVVVIGQDGQQILIKHGGYYVRVHPCRMQLCENENNISKNINSCNQNDVSPSVEIPSQPSAESRSSDHESDEEVVPIIEDAGDQGWKKVECHRDLPKIQTSVDCIFPDHQEPVTCRILSKAGKASTSNWHYLNIQESEETDGKCCSFKGVSWKLSDPDPVIENNITLPYYAEVFYGSSVENLSFHQAKLDEIQKWKDLDTL